MKIATIRQWLGLGIFLQSLIATTGSLYFSTFGDPVTNVLTGTMFPIGAGFEPCTLCWFARILMYPIVIISYIGLVTNDSRFTRYVLGLAVPGLLLEIYHYSLQKLPIKTVFECTSNRPCDGMYVDYFGFVTIPFLCLVAFLIIIALSVVHIRMTSLRKEAE